jgi:hypothetical protein
LDPRPHDDGPKPGSACSLSQSSPFPPSLQSCGASGSCDYNVNGESSTAYNWTRGISRLHEPITEMRYEKKRNWERAKSHRLACPSQPVLAEALCALEQPKPLRLKEMRRLVSLCRDKMTGGRSRGRSE